MSTCQHCGIGNAPHRQLCTTCGTELPKLSTGVSEELSALWRIRFDLVEKAGGPKVPLLNRLRFGQRFRLGFNLWALLFGPLYYVAKGMWRKALATLCLSLAVFIFIRVLAPDGALDSLGKAMQTTIGAWYILTANVNYYKKVVLGDNGWW
jgi:hypothetical protein